jgi:hypothetical protein
MDEKLTAVSITITKAEGTIAFNNTPITLTGDHIWAQARGALSALGQLDCKPDMLGVDKTDFTVVWSDGDEYSGTFGLTYTDNDLAAHILFHLSIDPAMLKRLGHDQAYIDAFVAYPSTHQIGD